MKKIITIVLLSSPVMVMAQGGKYTIKGKVGALSAPAKVYLRYSNDGVMVSDSVVPQNGLSARALSQLRKGRVILKQSRHSEIFNCT